MILVDFPFLYTIFIIGIALSRLSEVRISQQRFEAQRQDGEAKALPDSAYKGMVVFHTAWLISCVAEVYFLGRPWTPTLAGFMLFGFLLAMLGRAWVLSTMRENWNVRVVDRPDQKVVDTGPYAFIRHPNYVVVMAEIFFIPMVHNAWITAILGSVINYKLIMKRLDVEEAYLDTILGYSETMGIKPRFVPAAISKVASKLFWKAVDHKKQ